MFHQYIGDGGDLFLAIFITVVGFIAALGYVDKLKTDKDNEKNSPF